MINITIEGIEETEGIEEIEGIEDTITATNTTEINMITEEIIAEEITEETIEITKIEITVIIETDIKTGRIIDIIKKGINLLQALIKNKNKIRVSPNFLQICLEL